jgi:hypothetical protein
MTEEIEILYSSLRDVGTQGSSRSCALNGNMLCISLSVVTVTLNNEDVFVIPNGGVTFRLVNILKKRE